MGHAILDEHPAVVEIDRQLAELADAERASKGRVRAIVDPYREAVAEWREAANRAVLAGETPPERPPEPDLGDDEASGHLFHRRRSELRERRRKVLVEVAPDVERQAAEREAELRSQAQLLLAKLRSYSDEVDQLVQAVRTVRQAADAAGPERVQPSRAERMRSRVTLVDLVAAWTHLSESLLAVGPATGNAPVTAPSVATFEPEPPPPVPVPSRGREI